MVLLHILFSNFIFYTLTKQLDISLLKNWLIESFLLASAILWKNVWGEGGLVYYIFTIYPTVFLLSDPTFIKN